MVPRRTARGITPFHSDLKKVKIIDITDQYQPNKLGIDLSL
jgi:hypothetical protein